MCKMQWHAPASISSLLCTWLGHTVRLWCRREKEKREGREEHATNSLPGGKGEAGTQAVDEPCGLNVQSEPTRNEHPEKTPERIPMMRGNRCDRVTFGFGHSGSWLSNRQKHSTRDDFYFKFWGNERAAKCQDRRCLNCRSPCRWPGHPHPSPQPPHPLCLWPASQ